MMPMRLRILWLLTLLCSSALAAEPGDSGDSGVWQAAAAGYTWSFPEDLAAHPDYKTEWWYITGHLQLEDEPEAEPLGFQLTFFRVGLQHGTGDENPSAWSPGDLVMAHAALGDPASEKHIFSEVIWRATPFLGGFAAPGDTLLAWCQAPAGTDAQWSLQHRDGAFHLSVRDDAKGLRYDLVCTPSRDRVFHGDAGFSPKTPEGQSGSLYFSRTRMQVQGQVLRQGSIEKVKGQSWLDREIFTSTLGPQQKGWDWAALNLVDGTDLMLYRLRNEKGGEDFALGTMVAGDGRQESMTADRWDLKPLDYWTSPETGTRYPIRWELSLPEHNKRYVIKAAFAAQENVSALTGIHYWEGAVTVHPADSDGNENQTLLGRGFIELTGYGEDSRPPV